MRTDPPCVGLGGVNEYLRRPKVYEEEGRGRGKKGKKGKEIGRGGEEEKLRWGEGRYSAGVVREPSCIVNVA